jgi:predicted amidohydrolase
MRIATLQIAPKLGDVEGNIRRANELLKKGKYISMGGQDLGISIGAELLRPEILVLPEMAFTGMFYSILRQVRITKTGRIRCRIYLLLKPSTISQILTEISFRIQLPIVGSSQALP